MSTATTTVRPDQQYHAHHSHKATYIKIFGALMVLLILTVVAAFLPLGYANLPVALAIAALKGILIVLFFMHFKDSDTLTWIVGSGTMVWFGILIVLTLTDYLSRDWIHMPGK